MDPYAKWAGGRKRLDALRCRVRTDPLGALSEARSRQRSALVTLFGEGTANLQSDSRSRVTFLDDRYPRAPEPGLHVSVKEEEHE
jgi:hypothetical protein